MKLFLSLLTAQSMENLVLSNLLRKTMPISGSINSISVYSQEPNVPRPHWCAHSFGKI